MFRFFILTLMIFSFAFSKTNFSEMSNQELIAIMGYVKQNEKKDFERELKSRISTMSDKEKKAYIKNLPKLQR